MTWGEGRWDSLAFVTLIAPAKPVIPNLDPWNLTFLSGLFTALLFLLIILETTEKKNSNANHVSL